MILDPINDVACLAQLTQIAREMVPTTLIRLVARRLAERDPTVTPHETVVRWIQSRPQADDDGMEPVRVITCDVPQRVRLLADDPNCVERATDALMLLEALEQMGLERPAQRALATVDRPLRHTGLVEKRGGRWYAVDLFPRRNAAQSFSWVEFGKDVLQGAHNYIGKPILSAYKLDGAADAIGDFENKAIGRDKPKGPIAEKKPQPPSIPEPKPGRAGADTTKKPTTTQGGTDGERKTQTREDGEAGASPGRTGAAPRAEAGEGDDRRPHDDGEAAQRAGGGGRWWGLE